MHALALLGPPDCARLEGQGATQKAPQERPGHLVPAPHTGMLLHQESPSAPRQTTYPAEVGKAGESGHLPSLAKPTAPTSHGGGLRAK